MYKKLGRLATTHPWHICTAWAALGLLLGLVAPSWDHRAQDDDIRFLPARCASVRGYQLLEKAFPHDVFASRLIFAVERPDGPLTAGDLALVDRMVDDLKQLKRNEPGLGINNIASHRDPFIGKRLLSADGCCTLIQVALNSPYLALQTRTTVDRTHQVVRQRLREHCSCGRGQCPGHSEAAMPTCTPLAPPNLYATGPAGIGRDLITASADGLESTTLATILLVVVILLLVHRAPLLAVIPLITIAGSVFVALKLLALCTLIPGFYLVNISQVFAVVMLYGAGTDYCLFLISRYREELGRGHDRDTALVRSVAGVGGALVASAGTVVCGLGLMVLAEFTKVRCGGPAIAVSLTVALAASLTLAPALLKLLGPIAFWPVGLPGTAANTSEKEERPRFNLWDWLSGRVLARPLLVWGVSVVLLLPLALVGFHVKPNYRATGELAPTTSSVAGLAVIQRHFTAGEIGPVTVLLESPRDWDSTEGREVIRHLSRGFGYLDNVAEVRSLTQPLGALEDDKVTRWQGDKVTETEAHNPSVTLSPGHLVTLSSSQILNLQAMWGKVVQGMAEQVRRLTREFYVSKVKEAGGAERYVTRLDVVFRTDPFEPRSLPTLEVLQLWLSEGMPDSIEAMGEVRAECYGVTVNTRDLAEITESDRLRINTLVLAAVFLILLGLVRKPWLAGYLLATVLFSYFATLGATTLMAHYCSGRPLGEVDWRVPFFLFTILVAVGEDYNILLVSRALQEQKRHGPREGMRRALAHTGGTITSCGLIMAGTFATLMLAGLNTLVQIGFALAFGVLLDTFVVRPFLVPALTLWLWRDQSQEQQLPRARRARQEKPGAVTTFRQAA